MTLESLTADGHALVQALQSALDKQQIDEDFTQAQCNELLGKVRDAATTALLMALQLYVKPTGQNLNESSSAQVKKSGEMSVSVSADDDLVFPDDCTEVWLGHLPKRWSGDDLREWLTQMTITVEALDKSTRKDHGYVKVADVETRKALVNAVKSQYLLPDKPVVFGARRSHGQQQQCRQQRMAGANNAEASERDIRDSVCAWWNKPYHQQIAEKNKIAVNALKNVTQEVTRLIRQTVGTKRGGAGPAVPAWIEQDSAALTGLACPLDGVIRSPVVNGYRNKTEFTIGFDADEKPMVGFLVGSYKEGMTAVKNPDTCPHLSKNALFYAQAMQLYVSNVSKLPAYDKRVQKGFWRTLLIKEGRPGGTYLPQPGQASGWSEQHQQQTNQTQFGSLDIAPWLVTMPTGGAKDKRNEDGVEAGGMDMTKFEHIDAEQPQCEDVGILIVVNQDHTTQDVEDVEVQAAMQALIDAAAQASPPLPTPKVLVQRHNGVSNYAGSAAPILLAPKVRDSVKPGSTQDLQLRSVSDQLLNRSFSVQVSSFYQINSPGAAILYNVVAQWSNVDQDTLLLDICCGTGTIGLCLAASAGCVVGVDIDGGSIQDAQTNAERNGITNATFIHGKAEEELPKIIKKYVAGDHGKGSNEKEGSGDGLVQDATTNGGSTQANKQYSKVVAVVDPARPGLHKQAMMSILQCEAISRVVYVSCNPSTFTGNLSELCSPYDVKKSVNKSYWGPIVKYREFQPILAIAIDLFPHTPQVEMIALLQR